MRILSVKSNRQNMHLPSKFLPLVWCILQRPPFFARKNGRIGTASDSLISPKRGFSCGDNSIGNGSQKSFGVSILKCTFLDLYLSF